MKYYLINLKFKINKIFRISIIKENLTKLMNATKDLYNAVKSNSLADVEPNVTISEELADEFFK
jgi:hypothetical protein